MGPNLDDISLYLPKYLSADSKNKLFDSLKKFPFEQADRFFTTRLADESILFQGDIINEVEIVDIVDKQPRKVNALLISNTCDMDITNDRRTPPRLTCVPVFNLGRYKENLQKSSVRNIEEHITALKQQKITQMLYIPQNNLLAESFINFEQIYNIPSQSIDRDSLLERRLATFSDFGAYLLLFKISLHFTRIQDKVDRGC